MQTFGRTFREIKDCVRLANQNWNMLRGLPVDVRGRVLFTRRSNLSLVSLTGLSNLNFVGKNLVCKPHACEPVSREDGYETIKAESAIHALHLQHFRESRS